MTDPQKNAVKILVREYEELRHLTEEEFFSLLDFVFWQTQPIVCYPPAEVTTTYNGENPSSATEIDNFVFTSTPEI